MNYLRTALILILAIGLDPQVSKGDADITWHHRARRQNVVCVPPPGGCNAYGCWSANGGCNAYGCWPGDETAPATRLCYRLTPGNCNAYGCAGAGGGNNAYGAWTRGGGCNAYGCWHSPAGSCNAYGCTDNGACNAYGCPR